MRSVLFLCALSASAIAQTLPDLQKAVVHVEVDDVARLQALKMMKIGAPIAQLRNVKINQPYRLLLTGVAISRDGEIVLPALHPNANLRVEVTFHDGTQSLATVLGTDPHTNLALIKVPIALKHFLVLRNEPLAIKTAITLVGHHAQRKLQGLSIATELQRVREPVNLYNLYTGHFHANPLSVAVTINQAAPRAGTACVAADGKLAGLVVGALPPKMHVKGGNLYVLRGVYMQPTHRVARVVDELRKQGQVRRAFFGLKATAVPAEIKAHFPRLPKGAAVITMLQRDRPADKAGVRVNDIILSINGKRCESSCLLAEALSDCTPNQPAQLEVLRAGKKQKLTVTPTATPKR